MQLNLIHWKKFVNGLKIIFRNYILYIHLVIFKKNKSRERNIVQACWRCIEKKSHKLDVLSFLV